MDPKVYGKLLTTHRRGLGDDVEAYVVDSPSGGAPAKAPRWDLADTEGCSGGNSFSWCSWMFSGYVNIYRRKKQVGWATRGEGVPRGRRAPCLVASSLIAWCPLQVLWITFFPKITFPKVSFRLDSVWYSFSTKHWNMQKKQQFGLGLRLIG